MELGSTGVARLEAGEFRRSAHGTVGSQSGEEGAGHDSKLLVLVHDTNRHQMCPSVDRNPSLEEWQGSFLKIAVQNGI